MMSCLGPQAFFQSPMISTGTASGSVPAKTVQAVPFMPGFSSEVFMVSTGPASGRRIGVSAASAVLLRTASEYSTAAVRNFIG